MSWLHPDPNELRGQEAHTLALLQAHGKHEEAQAYLDGINRIRRAFGLPEAPMPEAYRTDLPDCVTCPALTEKVEQELRATMKMQRRAA